MFAVRIWGVVLLLALGLSACVNKESEARKLLNEAIREWQSGQIATADQKFQLIEDQYLETEVATEAIKERERLKEEYISSIDMDAMKRTNRGLFSRLVVKSIDTYYQEQQAYPKDLTAIALHEKDENQEFLQLCAYEVALFNSGYSLNCSAADKAYRSYRKKQLMQWRANQTTAIQTTAKPASNQAAGLYSFPKVTSTWGDKLNPGKSIPPSGFNAFYLDTTNGHRVIARENVNDISVNYSWSEFHNIKSEDFGAYWVGKISLEQAGVKQFTISQSRAKSRLIVDGHLVYEGGTKKSMLLQLDQGEHIIEVEYINDWHTTTFKLSIQEQVMKLSPSQFKAQLQSRYGSNFDVYFAGVYESPNQDFSIILNVGKSERDILLVLSSYDPVKWSISNPFNTRIIGVAYSASKEGSSVTGDLNAATARFPLANKVGSYSQQPRCDCSGVGFHCEGSTMLSTLTAVENLTGAKVTGFSGQYSSASLRVPEIVINEQTRQQQIDLARELEVKKRTCNARNNQAFDSVVK